MTKGSKLLYFRHRHRHRREAASNATGEQPPSGKWVSPSHFKRDSGFHLSPGSTVRLGTAALLMGPCRPPSPPVPTATPTPAPTPRRLLAALGGKFHCHSFCF